MILVYFTVGSTSSGSAFVSAPKLGAKTIFEFISLWRRLLPLYFLIRFLNWISHTFVLFKDITLTWINHLETWLCSDNMSCYYRKSELSNCDVEANFFGILRNEMVRDCNEFEIWILISNLFLIEFFVKGFNKFLTKFWSFWRKGAKWSQTGDLLPFLSKKTLVNYYLKCLYWCHDTKHHDTQHNDIQHKIKETAALSIIAIATEYAERHFCW
jgi:hypothetical protein